MRRTEAPGSIDNKYVDRNLDIGREGTLILAENMNDFQEEIANTIEEAGIELDAGDRAQLSKSVVLVGGNKDQQITGVKSFTSIPVLPAANPTLPNQGTRKGYVDGLDSMNVKLTGNQSISGTKTFSSSPVVPIPISASHAARKDYVDGLDAARKGYVDGLDATNVKLTGDQSISGTKTFSSSPVVPIPISASHAARKGYVDGLDSMNVKLTGNQQISGTKSFTGEVRPRTDPVTGDVSIAAGSPYTPDRGWYNGSYGDSTRTGGFNGPFSGTSATRIVNQTATTWYYARF